MHLLSRHLQHLLRDDRERVSDGVSLGWSILKFQPIELFSQFLLRSLLSMHPSALLRDPSKRPETFVDLKTLQREIYARCPEVYPDA